jgi:hypothetical protein
MSKKIEFTVERLTRKWYEAEVPDDFDTSDEWELIELSYLLEELDEETVDINTSLVSEAQA